MEGGGAGGGMVMGLPCGRCGITVPLQAESSAAAQAMIANLVTRYSP